MREKPRDLQKAIAINTVGGHIYIIYIHLYIEIAILKFFFSIITFYDSVKF